MAAVIAAPPPNAAKLVAINQEQLAILLQYSRVVPTGDPPSMSSGTTLLQHLYNQVDLLPRYNENADAALLLPQVKRELRTALEAIDQSHDQVSTLTAEKAML